MCGMQVKKASDFKEFNVKLDAWVKTLMSQVNMKKDQDVRFIRLKDTIRSQLNRLTLTDKTQVKTVYKVKGSDWVVEACGNRTHVCWILKIGRLRGDIRAQKWFLSLSYYVPFESLFLLMEQESIEEARFLSHQTDKWWQERWKIEMKEQCNIQSKRLRQVRIKGHPPSKNMMAEWQWMQDEIKRQKSRHELRFYEVEGVSEERKGLSGHSSVTIRVRSLSS